MTSSGDRIGVGDLSGSAWQARIAAAKEGDREALGEVFQRLRGYLRARAAGRLDERLRVKVSPSDVVQETLLHAYRGFEEFHGQSRGELVLWLQGILQHRVQTAYRVWRGAEKRNVARETPLHQVNNSHLEVQLAASASTPSGKAAAAEELEQLNAALRALPPRYEQVVRLRNELKLSFEEIGVALECSSNAAQKLWTRAVRQLSKELGGDA